MKTKVTLKNYLTLPEGFYTVAPNLVYIVRGNTRRFVFRYMLNGKRYDKSIGPVSKVDLTQAKNTAKEFLGKLVAGESLLKTKKEKLEEEYLKDDTPLFKRFADQTLEKIKDVKCWRNEKTYTNMVKYFDTYVYPVIGNKRIDEIKRTDVLAVLQPIWITKNETAQKIRTRLENILAYAVNDGYLEFNCALWKGNLDQYLPPPSKVKTVQHYTSMPFEELQEKIGIFLPTNNRTRQIIVFTILTACRVGETSGAKWSEFDFENNIWSIPPERRKDGKPYPHRVPLSRQVLEVLKSIERTSEFVFAINGEEGSKYSLTTMFKRMTGTNATMHGFRSTFRDWAAENEINDSVAEKCLMHSVGNAVVQAYQRSDLLELRRPVMQAWADAVLALQPDGQLSEPV